MTTSRIRNQVIKIRLTNDERTALTKVAFKKGLPVSAWMRALALAAALAGCSGAVVPVFVEPHQADELALVWHGMLEMDANIAPPPITWVDGVTCPDGNPMWPGIVNGPEGACAAGLFNNDYSGITLVIMPTWSETALAHELVHARCYMVHGDADDGHSRFPEEWAKVPQINEAITGDLL